MKLISWNVNGLRAAYDKGFRAFFDECGADAYCLQETKMQADQCAWEFPGYAAYWNSAVKKGYSGTLILTRQEPLSVSYGMGLEEHDQEGRVIAMELPSFYLVNCYTPNAQRDLARLPYRMRWEEDFKAYLHTLAEKKPVVLCGDLNVAHQEIDIKNAKSNRNSAGFTDQEREKMTQLLQSGFVDSYRMQHPDQRDAYTWWSYMGGARARNVGWRLDYFLVSEGYKEAIRSTAIHPDVLGSDHCPVEIELRDEMC